MNINAVVRLNEKLYEGDDFTRHGNDISFPTKSFLLFQIFSLLITNKQTKQTIIGIQHYDMSYPDGHNPTDEILETFLEMSHKNQGGIAVHCMAGLGKEPIFPFFTIVLDLHFFLIFRSS